MEQSKNAPQIRFEGFTDDWEQSRLGDFGLATSGLSIESEFNTDGKYKVISIGSYSEDSKYIDQGIRVNKTKITQDKILNKNDLAMVLNDKTSSGNIIGRTLLIDADDSYVYNQRTERIEVKCDEYIPEFLYQLLNADNMRLKVIRSSQGNTQIYVNWSTIRELLYQIPKSKEEQEKIGAYFSKFDHLITLYQQKYEKFLDLKKAMLYKLFPKEGETTPEIRFDGFHGAWKKRKLEELGEIITGSTPPTSIKNNYSNDGLIWVTPTDIKGSVTIDSERKLSMEGKKTARIVPKDTILVTCIASIGKNTMLGREGSFNQQINCIIPCRGKYHPYFLLTESVLWSNYMKKNAGLSAMQIVNRSEFSKIITLTPSYAEQKAIGEYFSKLDQLIALNKEKLEKLKNIKALLLDKMFV